MYFLDNNSGIATMPPLKETQSTTPLWFTEGDGHKGISWPGEDWFNIQQAEQLALLDAAGIRPDKGKLNQLTLAIRAIIGQEALLKTQALAEIAAAGKGAQEKARTHLGLGKLATQDGIEEATLYRKGIVQLSSAMDSSDESFAATPKAVKTAYDIANKRLEKAKNLADLPDKAKGRNNLDVHSKNEADSRYYPKTGGEINGSVISLGGHTILRGDDRKHFGFQNQDARSRMWLYKDKDGDGVRLNNGDDGGGDWLFHKNGHFHSPEALHAGGATYQTDGNIHGAVWGGHLSGWVDNRVNGRATWDYVNGTFVRDIRLGGLESVMAWNGPGYVDQGGYVLTGAANGNQDAYIDIIYRRPLQKNINGNWMNIGSI